MKLTVLPSVFAICFLLNSHKNSLRAYFQKSRELTLLGASVATIIFPMVNTALGRILLLIIRYTKKGHNCSNIKVP